MTESDDYEATIKELQAQLNAKNEILANVTHELEPLDNQEREVMAMRAKLEQEFREQMAKIQAQQIEVRNAKYLKEKEKYAAKQEADRIQAQIAKMREEALRKKAEEEAAAKREELNKALRERFDKATITAPWREWAKDHQIAAGHKIVEDRYVILADPMGLGKTLSSIITADMAEKVTRDASPEFPFLGQEEQVHVPSTWTWTEKAVKAVQSEEWPFFDGPLSSGISVTEPSNPFDEKAYRYRGRPIEVGETAGYMAYDLKNRLVEEGYLDYIPAHYEVQIVNSITRPVGRKILYFCPSPLLRNVMEEWRNWSPHRNVTYIGNMTKGERNFVLDLTLPKLEDYVIIVNYEAWRRDSALLDKLARCKFDTVIVDEAHNIKDMKTSAYKGVKSVIDACQPEYIIPMTGTPILNRPQELFSILTLVNPKEFYNERDFLWAYCEEYYTDDSSAPKYKFKPGGLDLLSKKISKNFLRRTKDQAGIVLPEKTIIYHELDLDTENYPEQAKARRHMKEYATIVIDEAAGKAIQATKIIALITRLRQIETWPAGIIQYETVTDPVTKKTTVVRDPNTGEKIIKLQLDVKESQKIDYIIRHDKTTGEWEGLIPDTIEDERIVVFSQFKAPLHELRDRVEKMGYKAAVFDGDTPQELREQIRRDFDRNHTPNRAETKYDVLLANYKAAGVGLNLTGATQLITLDEEWNPGKREQAWDRIHRIGQTQNVTINVVRTKDTIDTWLASLIEAKNSVVTGFENAMLSATDLKEALDSGLI